MAQIPSQVVAGDVLWEKIDEQTLSAAAAAVTFSGLDTTFTFFRLTGAIFADAALRPWIRLNNDSGATYENQKITASAAVVTGARQTAQNEWDITQDNIGTTDYAIETVLIAKPVSGEEAQMISADGHESGAPAPFLTLLGGQWNNTADLISRIDYVASANNFDADTRVLLEGAQPA